MTRIIRPSLVAACVAALLGGAGAAHGQAATEVFIPIGKSPGLSGRYTVVGHIKDIYEQDMTMTVVSSARTWTVKMTPESKVFLDRSHVRRRNTVGTTADCRPGVLCEIKFEGRGEPSSVNCQWIKIRPASTQPRVPTRRRGLRR